MRAVIAVLMLSVAACGASDPSQNAERNWQTCASLGAPEARVNACSAVIADSQAPVERRVDALINRASVRSLNADYARAVADLGRALRLDPNNARALLERGLLHHERGAYESAIVDYDAALRLDPNLGLAAERRAEAIEGRAGQFWRDLDLLDREIGANPRDPALLNNRCWLRAVNGQDLDRALADCSEALRIAPDNAAARDSRGLVHLKLGEYEAALADYDAALALEPWRGHYRYGRGLALIRLGREAEGRAELNAAIAAEPNVASLYASYGLEA